MWFYLQDLGCASAQDHKTFPYVHMLCYVVTLLYKLYVYINSLITDDLILETHR